MRNLPVFIRGTVRKRTQEKTSTTGQLAVLDATSADSVQPLQEMTKTAADVLIETLQAWGVDVVFGLPGDGINGIMESLRKKQDAIRFVQVRHEESAAFMACAYAKHTGKLGCCVATSGPGGIHLLNGLYDAKLDGQPVLAITGLQFHDLLHTHTQQDVALDRIFADVCVYNERCMGAAHMENIAELACRTAVAYRGVAHITIPVDFQDLEVKPHGNGRNPRNVANHVSEILRAECAPPLPGGSSKGGGDSESGKEGRDTGRSRGITCHGRAGTPG
ncbi:MAG: thiamine pyrophosphate-binding protein [Ignavibacteriota bacterium]